MSKRCSARRWLGPLRYRSQRHRLSHGHHLANDVRVIVSRSGLGVGGWGGGREGDEHGKHKAAKRKTDLAADTPKAASFGQYGVFAIVE